MMKLAAFEEQSGVDLLVYGIAAVASAFFVLAFAAGLRSLWRIEVILTETN